jgi:hypothetical protein
VHAERDAVVERRACERRIDAVLVEPVADLVHEREEAGQAEVVEPRRDPHVAARGRGGERVHGVVNAPLVAIKAHRLDDLQPDLALRGDRKVGGQRRRLGLHRDLAQQRHEAFAQAGEEHRHLGGGRTGLKAIEQRVVGMIGLGEAGRVALREFDVSAQRGREDREGVLLARIEPGGVAGRGGAGHLRGQLARHAPRALVVASHRADEQRILRARRRVEQCAQLGRHEPVVRQALERAERLTAGRGPGGRHHDLLVPLHDRPGVAEVRQLGEPLEQLSPCRLRLVLLRRRHARSPRATRSRSG